MTQPAPHGEPPIDDRWTTRDAAEPAAIEARLREIMVSQLDLDPARLTRQALLAEDLGVDSLAAIELGMVLEDEFSISLPDEVLVDIRSYDDAVRTVVALVRERATP